MLLLLSFFLLFMLILLIIILYTLLKNDDEQTNTSHGDHGSGRGAGPREVVVYEIFASKPKTWDTLFTEVDKFGGSGSNGGKKKRGKKRTGLVKEEMECFYPFSKPKTAIQRKIKQYYDQLVKAYGSKGLKVEHVDQFANCLVEAREEMEKKMKTLTRRFQVTDALLFRADRSTCARQLQQMDKIDSEQKRLEEDAFVYNWIQDQLKDSPAYKKMLKFSECMKKKEESIFMLENKDADITDISFEALLEKEKKSSFWQKNRKPKPCPAC